MGSGASSGAPRSQTRVQASEWWCLGRTEGQASGRVTTGGHGWRLFKSPQGVRSFPAVGRMELFPPGLKDRSVGVGPGVDSMGKDGNQTGRKDSWDPRTEAQRWVSGLVLSECPRQCSRLSVPLASLPCHLGSHPGTPCSMSSCVFPQSSAWVSCRGWRW